MIEGVSIPKVVRLIAEAFIVIWLKYLSFQFQKWFD